MERKFKKARLISITLMAALIFYGMVAATFYDLHGYGGSAESKMNFLRMIIFVVSFIQVAMAFVVRRVALNRTGPKEKQSFAAQLIVNAFCMAPAVFGMALTFMTRSFWDYGIFAAVSFVALGFFFPRETK